SQAPEPQEPQGGNTTTAPITAADIDGMWDFIGFYDTEDYSYNPVDGFVGLLSFSELTGFFYDNSGLTFTDAGTLTTGEFIILPDNRIMFTVPNGDGGNFAVVGDIFFDADGDLCIQIDGATLIGVYKFDEVWD
ncbi:MAG: hypothetical protein FWH20_08880, partial [Oscillospiraceae bacterium]|nr:hypothetical protein [Oscillospiraceae bacterium]